MGFEFQCQTCGEIHKGMPGFGADAPLSYHAVPEAERAFGGQRPIQLSYGRTEALHEPTGPRRATTR
jgi:hypothetical protein